MKTIILFKDGSGTGACCRGAAYSPLHSAAMLAASVRVLREVAIMFESTQEILQGRVLLEEKKKAERAYNDGKLRAEWLKRKLLRANTDVMFSTLLKEMHEQLDENDRLEHAALLADRKWKEWDSAAGRQ